MISKTQAIDFNYMITKSIILSGGRAYGSIYMGVRKIIIDTSRGSELSEIEGSLLLALALCN